MILDCLTIKDIEKIRTWRNIQIESLRTPFFLTQEMQKKFYDDQVC